jgi:hypothetical protein
MACALVVSQVPKGEGPGAPIFMLNLEKPTPPKRSVDGAPNYFSTLKVKVVVEWKG